MLLEIENLHLSFSGEDGDVEILRGISLSLKKGERIALVGESGCGKSMTSLAITSLPPTTKAKIRGGIAFQGKPLTGSNPKIAYIFQDPIASLNPVMRIERQLLENTPNGRATKDELISILREVDLPNPKEILRSYPCELSGGMCQRVMIAMALLQRPLLLVADEPTTALDVTTQQDVINLLQRIVKERQMALIMVTHNLGIVSKLCEKIYVLYAGQIVESGPISEVLHAPLSPYTKGLIAAVPKITDGKNNQLRDIPGVVPSPQEIATLTKLDDGYSCAFRPRCPYKNEECHKAVPLTKIVNHSVRCCRVPS